MHAVVRRYSGSSALSDAMAGRAQEVQDLLSEIPGFKAYYAVRSGDGLTTITVCNDQVGTQESNKRAAEWVRTNLSDIAISAPEVTEGDVFISF